jgi:two-component SAPR family response regulator
MKTILVDDMALDMQLLERKCADMPDFEIVGKFTLPEEAIDFAQTHEVEFANAGYRYAGMNGIELAMRLRQLREDIIIVFVTAHPRFAVEAFKMKADYMVFNPFDRNDIQDVLERAKLLQNRQKKRVFFHTFGSFEMLVNDRPVRFHSAKAKELMAPLRVL